MPSTVSRPTSSSSTPASTPSTPNDTVAPRRRHQGRPLRRRRQRTTRSGRWPGGGTQVEDLGGATVVPGLIDAHNHLLSTGLMLGQVQLYDCRSIGEVLERVAARARQDPAGTWIVGRGWDESLLAERRHPTRHDLDAVAPDHPVVIHRVWNKLVANSLALRLAGISRETPDPPADVLYAGSFERDERRRADRALPRPGQGPDPRPRPRADRGGTGRGDRHRLPRLQRGRPDRRGRAGPLPARDSRLSPAPPARAHLTVRTEMLLAGWGFGKAEEEGPGAIEARIVATGVEGGFGDDLLRLEGVKLMTDGGISDRTAQDERALRRRAGQHRHLGRRRRTSWRSGSAGSTTWAGRWTATPAATWPRRPSSAPTPRPRRRTRNRGCGTGSTTPTCRPPRRCA